MTRELPVEYLNNTPTEEVATHIILLTGAQDDIPLGITRRLEHGPKDDSGRNSMSLLYHGLGHWSRHRVGARDSGRAVISL